VGGVEEAVSRGVEVCGVYIAWMYIFVSGYGGYIRVIGMYSYCTIVLRSLIHKLNYEFSIFSVRIGKVSIFNLLKKKNIGTVTISHPPNGSARSTSVPVYNPLPFPYSKVTLPDPRCMCIHDQSLGPPSLPTPFFHHHCSFKSQVNSPKVGRGCQLYPSTRTW